LNKIKTIVHTSNRKNMKYLKMRLRWYKRCPTNETLQVAEMYKRQGRRVPNWLR